MQLTYTQLTCSNGPLRKHISLSSGKMVKRAAAQLSIGHAQRVSAATLAVYMRARSLTPANVAYTYGVPELDYVQLCSAALAADHPDAIQRDRKHFGWPQGPGIMMLDHDAAHMGGTYTQDEFLAAVLAVMPELTDADMAWAASSSSGIWDDTDPANPREMSALTGQRLYIPLLDATDIPRVGKVLYERLWAAGHGRYEVSQSGALLDRNIIDASVWQPERMDFAAPAQVDPPLRQVAMPYQVYSGPTRALDSHKLIANTSNQTKGRAAQARDAARAHAQPQAAAKREQYITARAQDMADAQGISFAQAAAATRAALDTRKLAGSFLLRPEGSPPVTVATILADPTAWHAKRCADPLEPDYQDDDRIGYIDTQASPPYIYSHAHGHNVHYELVAATTPIKPVLVLTDDIAQDSAAIIELLAATGVNYQQGGRLVTIAAGRAHPSTAHDVGYPVSQVVSLCKPTAKGGTKPVQLTSELRSALLRGDVLAALPELIAVTDHPTIRDDGSILQTPGYDAATKLYLALDADWPPIPDYPTIEQARAALDTLMHPFRGFAYADPLSGRSLTLAGVLTSVARSALPISPAIGISAALPGTGKTLFAKALLAAGGHLLDSIASNLTAEEINKVLFAACLDGSSSIFIDNVDRHKQIGGPALDGFLTAEVFKGRILGKSESCSLSARIFMIFTGNNLQPRSDTARRILICTLATWDKNPENAKYDFVPHEEIVENYKQYLSAALILLRARTVLDTAPANQMTSAYPKWSSLIAQTVDWCGRVVDPGRYTNINDCLSKALQDEREESDIGGAMSKLLSLWAADPYMATPRTIAEIVGHCDQHDSTALPAAMTAAANAARVNKTYAAGLSRISIGRLIKSQMGVPYGGHALHMHARMTHPTSQSAPTYYVKIV